MSKPRKIDIPFNSLLDSFEGSIVLVTAECLNQTFARIMSDEDRHTLSRIKIHTTFIVGQSFKFNINFRMYEWRYTLTPVTPIKGIDQITATFDDLIFLSTPN